MLGGKKRNGQHNTVTLLAQNTKVIGDVHFEGGLHVDGHIQGNILAQDPGSRLVVSDFGQIEGEVRVTEIVLNGMVKGDVYAAERIELGAKAKVEGNVYYNLIRMEAGATVNGKLVHKPGGQPMLALKHDGGKKDANAAPDKAVGNN